MSLKQGSLALIFSCLVSCGQGDLKDYFLAGNDSGSSGNSGVPTGSAVTEWTSKTRPQLKSSTLTSANIEWGALSTAVKYNLYYWTTAFVSLGSTTATSHTETTQINKVMKVCAENGDAVEFQCRILNTTPVPATEISGSFSDDFTDGTVDSRYYLKNPAQAAETSGYLQLNQNVTNDGPLLYLLYNRAGKRYVRITWRELNHRANNNYTWAGMTLNDFGTSNQNIAVSMYHDTFDSNYGITEVHYTRDVTSFPSGIISSISQLSATEIFDAWMTYVIELDFQNKTYIATVEGTSYPAVTLRDDFGPVLSLAFSPYGWFTGHYLRIDDLTINSQDVSF